MLKADFVRKIDKAIAEQEKCIRCCGYVGGNCVLISRFVNQRAAISYGEFLSPREGSFGFWGVQRDSKGVVSKGLTVEFRVNSLLHFKEHCLKNQSYRKF